MHVVQGAAICFVRLPLTQFEPRCRPAWRLWQQYRCRQLVLAAASLADIIVGSVGGQEVHLLCQLTSISGLGSQSPCTDIGATATAGHCHVEQANREPCLVVIWCLLRSDNRRFWMGLSNFCKNGPEENQPHCNVPEIGRAGGYGIHVNQRASRGAIQKAHNTSCMLCPVVHRQQCSKHCCLLSRHRGTVWL